MRVRAGSRAVGSQRRMGQQQQVVDRRPQPKAGLVQRRRRGDPAAGPGLGGARARPSFVGGWSSGRAAAKRASVVGRRAERRHQGGHPALVQRPDTWSGPPVTSGSRNRLTNGRNIDALRPLRGETPQRQHAQRIVLDLRGAGSLAAPSAGRGPTGRGRPGEVGAGQRLALEQLEASRATRKGGAPSAGKMHSRSLGDPQPLGQQVGRQGRPQPAAHRHEHARGWAPRGAARRGCLPCGRSRAPARLPPGTPPGSCAATRRAGRTAAGAARPRRAQGTSAARGRGGTLGTASSRSGTSSGSLAAGAASADRGSSRTGLARSFTRSSRATKVGRGETSITGRGGRSQQQQAFTPQRRPAARRAGWGAPSRPPPARRRAPAGRGSAPGVRAHRPCSRGGSSGSRSSQKPGVAENGLRPPALADRRLAIDAGGEQAVR